MRDDVRHIKIVAWSGEDQCFVGNCPGLFYGGRHGDDEQAVFAELCDIVEETIALYRKDGKPLPPPPVEMRARLAAFAEDWDSPEMDIYNDYDAARVQTR